MFMTILTGQVAQENWIILRHVFDRLCMKPPEGLVETELVQGLDDPTQWQVVTLWASQAAFEVANRAKLTAACEQMFCDAGSVPRRTQFRLVTRYQRV
jgi:hypothetical protein